MRRKVSPFVGVLAALAVLSTLTFAPAAVARVPDVYRKSTHERLGDGVERFTLKRSGPAEVVNVARIASGAPFDLRAIPAMGNIGDGLERTSAICKRVKCVLAVNGDFWKPGTDVPVGGVVAHGRLLRTPSANHAQVSLTPDGVITGPLKIRASLVPDDLKTLSINAVNRLPKKDELVLFTPAVGDSTRTRKGTIELPIRAVRPAGLVALRKTTLVRVAKNGSPYGNAPIPRDGAVLSGKGRGGRLLRDLLARIRNGRTSPEALLRIESTPGATESIGGSPVLVRNSKVVPIDARTNFVEGRHPRTAIGWMPSGEIVLVTVDGRQPGHSAGMTLAELARLMVNLGVDEAVNLDGGGSTTFVVRGKVINRPSDRAVRTPRGSRIVNKASDAEPSTIGNVERPVAIALALVPKGKTVHPVAPGVMNEIKVTAEDIAAAPNASDPASDPSGSMPELVLRTTHSQALVRGIAALVAVLALALAAAWTGYRHAHRRVV